MTGRYYLEDNDQLSLAVEAQHVLQERVIWRTRITAPAGDLLAMRDVSQKACSRACCRLSGRAPFRRSGSTPAHDEAYQLYLRSLALPQQPKPTERAIEMLERAVRSSRRSRLHGRRWAFATTTTAPGGRAQSRRDSSRWPRIARRWSSTPDLISAARQHRDPSH